MTKLKATTEIDDRSKKILERFWSSRRWADIDKFLESEVPSDSIGVNHLKGKFESKIQSRNVA